jgi:hypothetical protein
MCRNWMEDICLRRLVGDCERGLYMGLDVKVCTGVKYDGAYALHVNHDVNMD